VWAPLKIEFVFSKWAGVFEGSELRGAHPIEGTGNSQTLARGPIIIVVNTIGCPPPPSGFVFRRLGDFWGSKPGIIPRQRAENGRRDRATSARALAAFRGHRQAPIAPRLISAVFR